jgi:hypothetical protein
MIAASRQLSVDKTVILLRAPLVYLHRLHRISGDL